MYNLCNLCILYVILKLRQVYKGYFIKCVAFKNVTNQQKSKENTKLFFHFIQHILYSILCIIMKNIIMLEHVLMGPLSIEREITYPSTVT